MTTLIVGIILAAAAGFVLGMVYKGRLVNEAKKLAGKL